MNSFSEMGLPEDLINALKYMSFNEPTPIQNEAIPVALKGRDILGSAQTGTGKTAAYGIPLIAKLLLDPQSSALVLTPTRELATQVIQQIRAMLGKAKIKSSLLIGGESISKQLTQLRNKPRIIVGTPGRVNDHLRRKSLILHTTNFLVLDETDLMLDMGFSIQIENIMKYIPSKRQTLLFSATLPTNIVRIANKYLNNPVRVAVSTTMTPAVNIKQDILRISESKKYENLISQLDVREGYIIIFVKTKIGTEKMAANLSKDGYSTKAIHGDLKQNKRDRVIAGFRNKKYRILVATDVAARGLDIPHIEHVINYDLPQCAEDYIHRIGRTARAGTKGCALSIITPADNRKWSAIERFLNGDNKNSNVMQNNKKSQNKNSNKISFNRRKKNRRNNARKKVA